MKLELFKVKMLRMVGLVFNVCHPATFSRKKFLDLQICSASMGTLRGKSGEIAEILQDEMSCIINKTRFRGKSVRMISRGKKEEYKLLLIGNEQDVEG